jgi:hypothetical protein
MQITVEANVKPPIGDVWPAYISPKDIKQWSAA